MPGQLKETRIRMKRDDKENELELKDELFLNKSILIQFPFFRMAAEIILILLISELRVKIMI